MGMFDAQQKHTRVVDRLRGWPGPLGGAVLDGYTAAMRRWAPEQDGVTYFGATVRCDPVDTIQRMILLFKVWEPGVSAVIEANLRAGDVFVDIGANIGYDSLLAASLGADVVSVEAAPSTFARLTENLDRNPELGCRVRAVNVAVSDRPGELDLYEFGPSNTGATTTIAARHGTRCATVQAARLGDILTAAERAAVRLVKMDVEGAEPAILDDILDHLDDYPARMDILIEANPQDDRSRFEAVFRRLRDAGFTAWAIENRYSNGWYLSWQARPPRRLDAPPEQRCDLLLTRRDTL
jgi:FkbM family methyltransferase